MQVNKYFPHCAHLETDRNQDWFLSDKTYPAYVEVGKKYKPRTILEIGVRTGYSSMALLLENDRAEKLVGIDSEFYVPYSCRLALFNIKYFLAKSDPKRTNIDVKLYQGNTQAVSVKDILHEKLEISKYELIHIDGDHTYLGAKKDLEESLELLDKNGVIIVDDYSFLKGVKEAADDFIREHLHIIKKHYLKNSLRGLYIIEFN